MVDVAGAGDVGVFERIDVDGGAVGVVRPFGAAGHRTAVKRGGVVGFDGGMIVGAVVTDQSHFSDRISAAVEFPEDVGDLAGDVGMDDHFAGMIVSVKSPVGHPQIAQIGQGDGAAPVPGVAAEHAGFDRRSDGADVSRVSCEEKPGEGEEECIFFHGDMVAKKD